MKKNVSVRGLRPSTSLSDSLKIKELLNLIYIQEMQNILIEKGEWFGVKHNVFAVYSKNDHLKAFEFRRVGSKSVIAKIDLMVGCLLYYNRKKLLHIDKSDTLLFRELRRVCYG